MNQTGQQHVTQPVVTQNKPVVDPCDKCKKSRISELRKLIHSQPHAYDEFGMRITQSAQLKSLKDTHTSHSSSRSKNERLHTRKRPSKCEECGEECSQHMKEHVQKHKDGESLSCDECESKFVKKNSLANHKRGHAEQSTKKSRE